MLQVVKKMPDAVEYLECYLIQNKVTKLFLVCGNSYERLSISKCLNIIFDKNKIEIFFFRDFKPNPDFESVVKGIREYKNKKCDGIMAVGGGSAIDVAKCIKIFANADDIPEFPEQNVTANNIPFIAIPTTAGTGSEVTKFAVVYHKGEKRSVENESCIPSLVVLDPDTLLGLSDYQKKTTLLDAFSHSLESFWSVHSNDKSIQYSTEALKLILDNYKEYLLSGSPVSRDNMLLASNIAGKAINITYTTAGHAMCYKLTSKYGIPHGHAAALCNVQLFKYMIDNTDKCVDLRGKIYLDSMFNNLAKAMDTDSPTEAANLFEKIVENMVTDIPSADISDIECLTASVNVSRLGNNPVKLEPSVIRGLYEKIIRKDCL